MSDLGIQCVTMVVLVHNSSVRVIMTDCKINVGHIPNVFRPWVLVISPTYHPQHYIPRHCYMHFGLSDHLGMYGRIMVALGPISSIYMVMVCCHVNVGPIPSVL